jgi:uncharacterized protein (DUF1499 family)
MSLFSGSRPRDLGLAGGKLRGGTWKPNWVSSQVGASDTKHFIEPLHPPGPVDDAWTRLEKAIRATPRTTLVTADPGYMHAEFASALMGFVDDVEFALDAGAGVIHVRSGARLGLDDLGVNRKRIEAIRATLR